MVNQQEALNELVDIVRNLYNPQDTFSTKEIAGRLNISTPKAYKQCLQLEDLGVICKYGYKTKYGWEEPEYSKLRPNSLHWQVCL